MYNSFKYIMFFFLNRKSIKFTKFGLSNCYIVIKKYKIYKKKNKTFRPLDKREGSVIATQVFTTPNKTYVLGKFYFVNSTLNGIAQNSKVYV